MGFVVFRGSNPKYMTELTTQGKITNNSMNKEFSLDKTTLHTVLHDEHNISKV